MNNITKNEIITAPCRQLNLFGYEEHFTYFANLINKKKMPNVILFNGQKGLGKSTFVYHLVNYLLSQNEEESYNLKDFTISSENRSYKLLNSNTHPNVIIVDNIAKEKDIKIEQIRNVLRFTNKSTYSKDLKIIIIDNFENLNINSTNALLKAFEEPKANTYFFIIHNSSYKVTETIKSRCTEFKIFFSHEKKKLILKNLLSAEEYKKKDIFNDYFYFDTPGTILKCLFLLNKKKFTTDDFLFEALTFFIDSYKDDKNTDNFFFILLFIEKFYYKLCFSHQDNSNIYFYNCLKILKLLNNMKTYNLDEKNILFLINDILLNEKK